MKLFFAIKHFFILRFWQTTLKDRTPTRVFFHNKLKSGTYKCPNVKLMQ